MYTIVLIVIIRRTTETQSFQVASDESYARSLHRGLNNDRLTTSDRLNLLAGRRSYSGRNAIHLSQVNIIISDNSITPSPIAIIDKSLSCLNLFGPKLWKVDPGWSDLYSSPFALVCPFGIFCKIHSCTTKFVTYNSTHNIVSSPLPRYRGAEVFQKMAVWRGKVFFPKPEGAYSNRGGRGAKVFSYITDKYFLKGSCKSCILTINFPVIFLSSI